MKNKFELFSFAEKEELLSEIQTELRRFVNKSDTKIKGKSKKYYLDHIENHIQVIEKIKGSNDLDFILDENLYIKLRLVAERYL